MPLYSSYPTTTQANSGNLMLMAVPGSGQVAIKMGDFQNSISGYNFRISGGYLQIWDSGISGYYTLNVYNGNFFLS